MDYSFLYLPLASASLIPQSCLNRTSRAQTLKRLMLRYWEIENIQKRVLKKSANKSTTTAQYPFCIQLVYKHSFAFLQRKWTLYYYVLPIMDKSICFSNFSFLEIIFFHPFPMKGLIPSLFLPILSCSPSSISPWGSLCMATALNE